MASYFRASLSTFLQTDQAVILTKLTLAYANSGFAQMHTDVPVTWWHDLASLRQSLDELESIHPSAGRWQILLEFSIPRKERRLDVVLLTGAEIILLECKRGEAAGDAIKQVEEYALLLHYFHEPSNLQNILDSLTGAWHNSDWEFDEMPQQEVFFEGKLGDRHIEILKTYDQNLAREAFVNMNEAAKTHLWNSLGIEEAYESEDLPPFHDPDRGDFLWDELLDGAREDGNLLSFFVVNEAGESTSESLYVSPDWPSAEDFARRSVVASAARNSPSDRV